VIGILGLKTEQPLDAQHENLLEAFANGLALALERTFLAKESQEAKLSAESERLRNVLLNSVSHDLRTPLTIIGGAAVALKERKGDPVELTDTIVEQSERLNRHVQNLLDMTRLDARTVEPKFDWHSVEEVVGSALRHSREVLKGRHVSVDLASELPLVRVDGMLIEKALVNLLENAARHTPEASEVRVRASVERQVLRFEVTDDGVGIAPGDEGRIFEKFYQPGGASDDRGFGLGLAICRAVAIAHGGRAWAINRTAGGASFFLDLALPDHAPGVPLG